MHNALINNNSQGMEGSRIVSLKEGTNNVVIEVTAPNGNTQCYRIVVTRLAANLAELSNLTLVGGKLDRVYQKKYTEYYATLGITILGLVQRSKINT